MNIQSIYEQNEIDDYEDEHSVIKYQNNLIEINAPHETRVIHNNTKRDISYFDIKPLLLIMADINSKINKDHGNEIYTLYGNIGRYEYRVTINTKSPMVEMVNITLNFTANVTSDFSNYDIPELEYPIYQFTENPVIAILVLFAVGCYASDDDSNYIMHAAEILTDRTDTNETYYLDEFGIMIMSVYQQCYWIKQSDMMGIINTKSEELKNKVVDLELEKMTSEDVYMYQGHAISNHIKIKIKNAKKILVLYARLESMLKLVNPDDEIMEIKIGNKSHFMLKRCNNIMKIQKNEFNTPLFTFIDSELKTIYDAICQSHDSVVYKYNTWCDNIISTQKNSTINQNMANNENETFMPYHI
jgi:hypothetical protein